MGQPAAVFGSTVTAVDTHVVLEPSGVAVPLPAPFAGRISEGLSPNVKIEGKAAAVVGSGANNEPPHIPPPPGTSFVRPPSNHGTVQSGSATVRINGRPAARAGDPVLTCNDPVDLPVGQVVAVGTVRIG
jgi:uncharacterized Zn-binding protein involved in type VI secretion